MELTITEALAEIKTLGKRIAKKRDGMRQYLARQEGVKDPLAKDGGSVAFIAAEAQSIRDLEERIVELRRRIAAANASTLLVTEGITRPIADWLTWRREVVPGLREFLGRLQAEVQAARQEALKRGVQAVGLGSEAASPLDILVNISERDLAQERDQLEVVLGTLDGLLSLKNATTTI